LAFHFFPILKEDLNFRKRKPSRKLALTVIIDGRPKNSKEVQKAAGLSVSAANNALTLCWKRFGYLH